MIKVKKLSAALAVLLSFAMLTGCSDKPSDTAETTAASVTEAAVPESRLAELTGGRAVIPQLTFDSYELPETDAMAFVKDMKLGWNLGNTLDATDDSGSNANDLDIEKAWVGVKTTKEHIDNIKHAGFNTVRVPVSWHNHIDENYTINEPFLNRVQEVVDYVIDNDMYCILNIHHDTELEYFYPDSEHFDQSAKYIETIWTQLSEKFKDYDNKLIFEGINEPRLKGTGLEWYLNANDPKGKDSVECLNKHMQSFVDIVRASGGNNADRYLMVPGYCASPDGVLSDLFVMPTDSADNKIILSVHAYTPYNFALQADAETEWSADNSNSTSPITQFMDNLYSKFTSQGIPVVIGEFGARNKGENTQARTDFAAFYVGSARARGITCVWWDNNAFYGQGENFGLFDRKTITWKYADIVLAMLEYAE